jgi:hypothetical protein
MSDAPQPLAVKQSLQGSRVKQELEALREKQLAKNQRDKFKDRTLYFPFCLPPCSRFAFFNVARSLAVSSISSIHLLSCCFFPVVGCCSHGRVPLRRRRNDDDVPRMLL